MWDDIQGWFGTLGDVLTPDLRGLWDDVRSGKLDWEQLSPEQQKIIGDAVAGGAGVEGKSMDYFGLAPDAIRGTTPSTEEIAANPDIYAYRGGELLAPLPPPTPLEEKRVHMEGRGGYDAAVAEMNAPKKPKKDKEDDFYSQLFLASLMEEMGGGKVGQAPGVVTGGGFGGLPSMMGQFRRQQKPWWIV